MITVATWNVLHRVHAENWGDEVVRHWPDESERIAAITARLAGRTENVLALQEVSGDQLDSLRLALPDRTVHTFRYPRIPTPRHRGCPLRDPSEYLVLLVDRPSRTVTAESFESDPGKGALAVTVADALVLATHVSGNHRRTLQLARLAELAASSTGQPTLLLGDFNTDRDTVTSNLGPGFTAAQLPPDTLPTRPPLNIDHVVARDAGVGCAAVEDVDGLSDHNLVRATIHTS